MPIKVEYTLTPRLRVFLKEPFGTLVEGTPKETMSRLKEIVAKEKPPKLITVGDIVTENTHEFGMQPQLSIIDYISLRDQAMPRTAPVERTVYARNPQGTITDEAIEAVKTGLDTSHTHVVVEGEEDLLTLIAVMYAPPNSVVVYGQPHLGIVIIKASEKKKAEAKRLLNEMKSSKS